MHALHDGTNTLKSHARIDTWRRQFFKSAVFLAVKLHKDVVPNLDKTVAVFFRCTWQTAPNMLAVVIKYFGTRTTRTCVTHCPKVIRLVLTAFIITNTDDALGRQAHHVMPNIKGFIIGVIHGHIQLVFWQTKPFIRCQKLPTKWDGLLFKIIAKRKVAEHLKKRMVTRGIADVVKVIVFTACAHTFLRRYCTFIIAFVYP